MPLKLRLKSGDRLILGSAYLEVERIGLTTVAVSIDAPQEVAILTLRKTTCKDSTEPPQLDSR